MLASPDRWHAGPVTSSHVVVVGGGVAGLAAAWSLVREHRVDRVTVLESSPRVGGKLASATLEGLPIDTGAEVVLAHSTDAVPLLDDAGLGADLVAPRPGPTAVLVGGQVRTLPGPMLSGIPTDLSAVARSQVLDPTALARLPLDHVLPRTEIADDISVGRLVGERLGPQVVDRLLSPVLGGIHAGPVMDLSLRATMPELFHRMRHERSVMAAAAALLRPTNHAVGPRYVGVAGGLGRLPAAIAELLVAAGAVVRTGVAVRGLMRTSSGWRLEAGSATAPEAVGADGVVLAVPATPASRLLRDVALGASVHLGEIRSASVATVALAYRKTELEPPPSTDGPGLVRLPGSSVLVPGSEGRAVTGVVAADAHWPWLEELATARDLAVVKVSVGRLGEEAVLQRDDVELAALAHAEVAFLQRTGRATPTASVVQRWGGALPQYTVGHADRVAAIRESVAGQPALAVCGAAYDGTGVAACIASGRRAAGTVATALRTSSRAAC